MIFVLQSTIMVKVVLMNQRHKLIIKLSSFANVVASVIIKTVPINLVGADLLELFFRLSFCQQNQIYSEISKWGIGQIWVSFILYSTKNSEKLLTFIQIMRSLKSERCNIYSFLSSLDFEESPNGQALTGSSKLSTFTEFQASVELVDGCSSQFGTCHADCWRRIILLKHKQVFFPRFLLICHVLDAFFLEKDSAVIINKSFAEKNAILPLKMLIIYILLCVISQLR